MTTTSRAARTSTDGITGRRRVALRVLAPVLIAGAFAGLAGATDVAAAPARSAGPAAASAAVHYTQGFDIRNLSSHTITLSAIDSPGRGDGAPYIGTVLRPGESLHYEKVWWFGDTPKTKLTFSDDDGSGGVRVFQMELWVDSFLKTPSIMMPTATVASAVWTSRVWATPRSGPRSSIRSARRSPCPMRTSSGRPICSTGSAPAARPVARSGPAPPGGSGAGLPQGLGGQPVRRAAAGHRVGRLHLQCQLSVEGTVSAKMTLFGLVDTTLSAKYGKTWSEGRTGTISRTFKVSPGHRGYVEVHQPTTRQHGDFTVTMGNTVWHLTNVYFDIPDMSRTPDVVSGEEKV